LPIKTNYNKAKLQVIENCPMFKASIIFDCEQLFRTTKNLLWSIKYLIIIEATVSF
jgi:hypothetical protein